MVRFLIIEDSSRRIWRSNYFLCPSNQYA